MELTFYLRCFFIIGFLFFQIAFGGGPLNHSLMFFGKIHDLKVGLNPPGEPILMNESTYGGLNKSYKSILNVSKVNLFSGSQSVVLPLIDIPVANGLSFKLTLKYGHSLPHATENCSGIDMSNCDTDGRIIRNTGVGVNWSDYVGILSGHRAEYQFNQNPVFIDPDGVSHELYPIGDGNQYQLKDNWFAKLDKVNCSPDYFGGMYRYNGVVYSPLGIEYHVTAGEQNTSPVDKITVPNGSANIQYYYNGDLLQKISTSSGYIVTFNYNTKDGISILTSIEGNDGRSWIFQYSDIPFKGVTRPIVSEVKLPNSDSWLFKWVQFTTSTGVSGMMKSFTYNRLKKITAPSGASIEYEFTMPERYFIETIYMYRDRLSVPFVSSKTLSGPGIPEGMTWVYKYEKGKISDPYGQQYLFSGKTTILGPYKKVIYQMNSDVDQYDICIFGPPGSGVVVK